MTKPHPAAQVKTKTELVKKIMKHHFGSMPKGVKFKPAGLTNFVFEAESKAGKFIVRIGNSSRKISDYIKEQWAVERAAEKGVPVAEILEVGNEVIPLPYMLQRKLEGKEALHHPGRLNILYEMGYYARLIHSISTSNYGHVFDWSKNLLSKNYTLKSFLHDEWKIDHRLQVLEKNNVLEKKQMSKLVAAINKMEKWTIAPSLNHGDIRLKNVITSEKGKIMAIIDWENCTSNVAPFWDLSIALHDLSIEGRHNFLQGYGIDPSEYREMAYGIKVFNILNYTSTIEKIVSTNDTAALQYHILRLNGYLDLFSF
jgi:hygromycin-B 4-O-kinase